MKTEIARLNSSALLIQRFSDDDEIDERVIVSNTELLELMQFVKSEIGGDWPDVMEYLTDRADAV